MNAVQFIEQKYTQKKIPQFKAGDTVRVYVKITEGDKERTQIYEGVVIRIHRRSTGSSFTVRKISFGVGVERIFPYFSPVVQKIEVVNEGKIRRAKLYYLRDLQGRKARIISMDRARPVEEEPAK